MHVSASELSPEFPAEDCNEEEKMFTPFQLPNELLLSTLFAQYPCREPQIRALATLLSVCLSRNAPFMPAAGDPVSVGSMMSFDLKWVGLLLI